MTEIFVPGRICLFGEHSDWAGSYRRINSAIEKGYCLITGTNQGHYARVKACQGRLIYRTRTADGSEKVLDTEMNAEKLLSIAEENGFFSYIAGVAYQILTHYQVDGIEIDNYRSDLPLKKGLSSSAAVCVLCARAFNRVYDLKMTIRGEMEMAYRGEITTASRCGRMDQGCAYGERPIEMCFDGDALLVEELHVPRPLHYLIVDLKAGKDTVKILSDLNRAYPFADTELQNKVQQYLGPENKAFTRKAREAIENGDAEILGSLMNQAQSAFDAAMTPACPQELTAPVLHTLLAALQERKDLAALVLGAKGVGSQGDGTAQILVRDEAAQTRTAAILEKEFGFECLPLTVPATKAVKKALITAAGFGTRLFPMTRLIRKEFMPVLDGDGRMLPLILDHVLSASDAGIEEIGLVIQRDEEALFRKLFKEALDTEVFAKLSEENQILSRRILQAGNKVHFLYQDEQKGLGHALLQAAKWLGDNPFLLILGDHYFTSNNSKSCTAQLLEAYGRLDCALLGLARTDEKDIGRFGTVAAVQDQDTNEESAILSIRAIHEKPDINYADEYLRSPGLPDHVYYTVFGLYVLPSRILSILSRMEKDGAYERGELQLSGALDELRTEQGMKALEVAGQKRDIGVPEEYAGVFARI